MVEQVIAESQQPFVLNKAQDEIVNDEQGQTVQLYTKPESCNDQPLENADAYRGHAPSEHSELDISRSMMGRYLSFSRSRRTGSIPATPFTCRTVADEMDEMDDMATEADLELSLPGVAFAPSEKIGCFRVTKAVVGLGQARDPSLSMKSVIILFGWLGCQDRHLMKYAQGVFWAVRSMLRDVTKHFPRNRIVIHYFSNGGCFCHWRLLQLLRSGRFEFPQLAATIFDSSPATASALTAARAMSASSKSAIARAIIYGGVRFSLEVWGVMQLWTWERKYLREILRDTLTIPSFYVYSEDDHITEAAIVEQVIEKRRAYFVTQGLSPDMIEVWKLQESSHVCHFPKYPEEYRSRICGFLTKLDLL